MNWNNLERFPPSNNQWQTIDRHNNLVSGEGNVRKTAAKWFPLSLTLYATPASHRFTLAITIPEIAGFVHTRFAFKFRIMIGICIFYLFILLILSLSINNFLIFSKTFFLLLFFLSYCIIEYRLFVKSYTRLKEHSLFFNWVIFNRNSLVKTLTGITLVCGIFQVVYQTLFGDLDTLLVNFGIYYTAANSGEWWRYLYGSFIHKDVFHWSVNFGMLFIASSLAGPFSKSSQVLSFILTTALSAFAAQFPLIGENPEAFGGISGGVYGLLGWVVGDGFRNRKKLPKEYYLRILMFSVANLLMPVILDLRMSLAAHLVGLVSGLLLGLAGISAKEH